jgi:PEP-CTERM motif
MMLALALVIPALAMAADFTYSTTGTFSGGAGCTTNTCTVGTATLSFVGSAGGPFSPGTDVTMGTFTNTVAGSGNNFSGIGFTLNVIQTAPGSGTGQVIGTLQGTISSNSSNGTLQFASSSALSTSITAGGLVTIYTLDTTLGPGACLGLSNCISLGGPNQNAAVTAFVTQVPEPASIMMFGTGLTGLAGLVRRRMKK